MDYKRTKEILEKRLSGVDGDREHYAALLFDALERYNAASEHVTRHGQVMMSESRCFINPSVNIINESHKQILKLMDLLGIAPTAKEKEEAGFEDVLK